MHLINRVNDPSNLLAASTAIIWEICLDAHIDDCIGNDEALHSTAFDAFLTFPTPFCQISTRCTWSVKL